MTRSIPEAYSKSYCDARPAPSSGAQHAGRFLVAVWNPSSDWREAGIEEMDERLGKFDAMDAVGVWDDAHRLAFMAWFDAPFWP